MSNSRYQLQDYFAHIGLPADYKPEPTLKCLHEISWAHLRKWPYNNSYLYAEGQKPDADRVVPSLDPDNVFELMVTQGKALYCYLNLALLRDALTRAGFTVTEHLSKVILLTPPEIDEKVMAAKPHAHAVLKVKLDGDEYIIDSGFSNESLRQPLKLTAGTHELEADDYLLEEHDNIWRLSSLRYKDDVSYWFTLYQFNKNAATQEELDQAHFNLYHADNVPIRDDKLLFSEVTYSKRKFVMWSSSENSGLFRSVNMDGTIRKEQQLSSEQEVRELAQRKFGV